MMALILASGIDAQKAVVFHQDEVAQVTRCPLGLLITSRIGSEPCGTCLDSELYNTDRKTEADDYVEGASVLHIYTFLTTGMITYMIAVSASNFEERQ